MYMYTSILYITWLARKLEHAIQSTFDLVIQIKERLYMCIYGSTPHCSPRAPPLTGVAVYYLIANCGRLAPGLQVVRFLTIKKNVLNF
jgi:hypothetical protein